MFCPNCGKQVNDNDAFCAFCGETLQPQTTQTTQTYQQPHQNPYQQPQRPPELARGGTGPQAKKPNIPAIAGAAVAALALIAGGAALLKKDPPKSDPASSAASTADQQAPTGSTADTSAAVSTLPGESPLTDTSAGDPASAETQPPADSATDTQTTTQSPETTATTTTTTKPPETTTTTKATTKAATTTTDYRNAIYEEAWNYSTFDRPSFSEFDWCFGQNGLIYTPPENVTAIKEPLAYTGGWKAMVIYNPTNMAGTFMRELDNIEIGVYDDTCTITIDWYLMDIDSSETYDETDMEDTSFFGTADKNGLKASGAADIELSYIWKADGNEYALGTLTADGIPAYLAMFRP